MRNNKKPKLRSLFTLPLLILLLTIFIFFIIFSSFKSSFTLLNSNSPSSPFPQCRRDGLGVGGEKFLFYAPHSGFSNQLSELKNALLMAAILNRTLIVPPVLDHHAVALGSCPKFRVLSPSELRLKVWDHTIELIRQGRYISMADVIDLSPISSMVRIIDLSDFVSLWCGVDLESVCSHDSIAQSCVLNRLRQCGFLLSGLKGNVNECLYAVDVDCRTTVWTYEPDGSDGTLDSFQIDDQLRKKKKLSFVRHRKDVQKHLGPGSEAHGSTLLAFGSLFTAPYRGSQSYIDIHKSPREVRIRSLINKIEYLPFLPNIHNAGKKFVQTEIRTPFLCAQLRLLDGQFKNHWNATFLELKQKAEALKEKRSLPVHVFVMTDLPKSNWRGSYLGDLERDRSSFKVHVLSSEDDIVKQAAEKVAADHRMRLSHCPHQPPDLLLYIEETVCSCAALGFVGTAGSTIAESIRLMRKGSFC